MRLINADALNQYKFGEGLMASSYADGWDDAIDAIMKDAPTVEVRDNFDIGYAQGLEDGRNERPKGYIHIDDVFRLIAGHSNYHGNDILSAFVCLSEGKKIINAIKPIE